MNDLLAPLRYFLMGISLIFSTLLGLLFCLTRPFNPLNIYTVGRLLGKGITRIAGIKVEIEGEQYWKENIPLIIISNHQSNFDAFTIGQIIPKRTVSIGKKAIAYFPFFGQLYWLSGNILIDRFHRTKAFKTMGNAALQIKKKNLKAWIMPEGTRSRGRGLLPFKKGAFFLSFHHNIPITMVCVSSYKLFMDIRKWHCVTVRIKVFPPLLPKEILKEALSNNEHNENEDDNPISFLKDYFEKKMKKELSLLDHRIYGKK